jgi:hypothetical protein
MNKSLLSAAISLSILFALCLGCGGSGSGDTATSGNSTSTTSSTPSSTSNTEDINGTYDITGTNENGAGAYKGTLVVTNRGDVHQFSWDTAGKKYDGVGVRTGNAVASAFAEGQSGEGCGVVLYKIGADGSLDGKAGYWGNNSSETETAKRTKGTALEGSYEVSGTNTGGQPYKGTLEIKQSGAGYTFSWKAGSAFEGFGVRQGDTVAVGFGGSKCGFVSYEIKPGGALEGKWGGYGSKSVGTEVAKKR